MTLTLIVASVLAMQATAAPAEAVANADDKIVVSGEKAEVAAKPKKITDRSHPDFVRCQTESVIGSRAKRKKTCMTNAEWDRVARAGNEGARDLVAAGSQGGMAESN